jgi:hypothetical protein
LVGEQHAGHVHLRKIKEDLCNIVALLEQAMGSANQAINYSYTTLRA